MSRHYPDALAAYRREPVKPYTLPGWLVVLMITFAAACPVLAFSLGG
jgi:hypothetical protein